VADYNTIVATEGDTVVDASGVRKMAEYQRIRKQQLLREAEGYLELITSFDDQFAPAMSLRKKIAERALAVLKRLPPTSGFRGHALYLEGQALRALQRYGEAAEPLRQAAELDPENIRLWLALGWCYKRTGRLDLAIQALEEALCVDSSEAIIHYNLACYWSLARNAKLSVAYLARAFELDPNYRDHVLTESDFDPVRNHAEFLSLTSVIV
jgi:tetratricopeptide (TPR) repeat protein